MSSLLEIKIKLIIIKILYTCLALFVVYNPEVTLISQHKQKPIYLRMYTYVSDKCKCMSNSLFLLVVIVLLEYY